MSYPEPIYEKILMRPLDNKERKTRGGIIALPPGPHSKIELRMGEVIAVGQQGERTDGQLGTRPHVVKPGDEVLYAWAGGVPMYYDNPETGVREDLVMTIVDHIFAITKRAGEE